jgi:hypothetical protein
LDLENLKITELLFSFLFGFVSEGETEATNEEGEENGDEESSSEELAESELIQEDCNKKTVKELRAQCKTLGIKSSGRKGDLIQRILKFQYVIFSLSCFNFPDNLV